MLPISSNFRPFPHLIRASCLASTFAFGVGPTLSTRPDQVILISFPLVEIRGLNLLGKLSYIHVTHTQHDFGRLVDNNT